VRAELWSLNPQKFSQNNSIGGFITSLKE